MCRRQIHHFLSALTGEISADYHFKFSVRYATIVLRRRYYYRGYMGVRVPLLPRVRFVRPALPCCCRDHQIDVEVEPTGDACYDRE